MALLPQRLLLLVCALLTVGNLFAQDWAAQRQRMVDEQIRARGISHPGVLQAMREVPRHLFVPPAVRAHSYADHPLAIGYEATISQPYIVALMTELLQPAPSDIVLEIGTGSGYQAAVLARLVKHVYTIELVPELAARAAATLKDLGFSNVTVRQGDGYLGWPEAAPFQGIMLTAAPEKIPQTLIDQLAPNGRLVAPEGGQWLGQELMLLRKDGKGKISRKSVLGVRFVPMRKASPTTP